MLICSEGKDSNELNVDRIPALNNNPLDVSGAGDIMLTTSSMTLASGGDIWEAGYIGSLSAAIQIDRLGNIPLQRQEIISHLKK